MSGTIKTCSCGARAEFLCDALVPLTKPQMLDRLKKGQRVNGERATCDAPLCEKCRVKRATTFVCARPGCEVDSYDICAKHDVKDRLGL